MLEALFLLQRGPSIPTRHLIRALIERHHGITKSELCQRTGLGWGTVSHHVRRLERSGEVRLQRTLRRVFLYPAGVEGAAMMRLRLVRRAETGRILRHLRAFPGAGIQGMSRPLGLSRKALRRHLRDLLDAGLVTRSHDYRPRFYASEDNAGEGGGPFGAGARGPRLGSAPSLAPPGASRQSAVGGEDHSGASASAVPTTVEAPPTSGQR